MPANKRNAIVGLQNRNQVLSALLGFGAAGADAKEILAATNLSSKSIAFYCRSTAGVHRAGLSSNHEVRWFHPDHKAGADAYQASLDDRIVVRHRWSPALLDAGIAMVTASGEAGCKIDDIAQQLGCCRSTASWMLATAVKDGLLKRRNLARGHRLFFGLQIDVPPRERRRASKAKPKELHKKSGPKVGSKRIPKDHQKLTVKPTKPQAPKRPTGPAIVPENVKRTICPPFEDRRFAVDGYTPFWGRGGMLETGSAIEKHCMAKGGK